MSRPAPPAAERVGAAGAPPLSLRDAYRFFVPLMLMAELMMISHAVITAFLARMTDPQPILAAYSIAFYTHSTLGSPVWACQIVAISYIHSRQSIWRLLAFNGQVVASVAGIWMLLSLSPLGDWFFGTLFGASDAVAREAKLCMLVSFLVVPFAVVRSLAYALLMIRRHTLMVTYGTFVRLVGLGLLLVVLSRFAEGALVGVVALVGCIGIESVYSAFAARRHFRELPALAERLPGFRELWRFSWPIMLMQAAESGVAFTVNFFLGRLPRPELALAAFGVLDSLVRVLLSPLRNLTQTAQTLVQSRGDMRIVFVFATQVSLGFAMVLAALAVLPPVRGWVLEGVMGLPEDIAGYLAPALGFAWLLALCMAAAALTRGVLIASRRTGAIAVASLGRIAAVGAVGTVAIALGADNGAMVGMAALVGAFAAEAAIVGGRLRVLLRANPRLPEPA